MLPHATNEKPYIQFTPSTADTCITARPVSIPPPTHNWMLTRTVHSCPLIGWFWQSYLLIGPNLPNIWAPPGGALFQSSISSVHMDHKTLQTPPRIFVPSLTWQVKKSFMLRINSIEVPSVTLNNMKNAIPPKSLCKCQDFCNHLTDWV